MSGVRVGALAGVARVRALERRVDVGIGVLDLGLAVRENIAFRYVAREEDGGWRGGDGAHKGGKGEGAHLVGRGSNSESRFCWGARPRATTTSSKAAPFYLVNSEARKSAENKQQISQAVKQLSGQVRLQSVL